jgi:Concanavalin A-like lectin/glucanases superfamily
MKRSLVVLAVASVVAAPFAAAASAQAAPAAAPPPGMSVVADWEMNEAPGATVAHDSGPNGIDGAVGSVIQTGLSDGTNTFFRYPFTKPNVTPADTPRLVTADSAALNPGTRDFSISFTYRTTHNFGNIIQKGQHGAPGGYFKIEQPLGHLSCLFRGVLPNGQLSGVLVNSGGLLDDGLWHSIVCTRTANEVTMTVDGTDIQRTAGQSGNISNSVPLTIGGKTNCDQVTITCDFFSGDIDRVELDALNPPPPAPGFVASAGSAASGKVAKVQIPAIAQPGELLLLQTNYVNTTAAATGPAGWTQLGTSDAGGLASTVWWKIAGVSDPGSTVAVNLSASAKSTTELLAYAGVNQTNPIDAFATAVDKNTPTHTTPTVTANTGDWAVSLWSDKSTTTTSWIAPTAVTTRDVRIGTGPTHVSSLSADSGATITGPSYGGLAATTNANSTRATMWTIAIAMQ